MSFEAAVALILEKEFIGNSFLTARSNDKGADIVFFGEDTNSLVQVKQSSNKLGISSGQEIKYALPQYEKTYGKVFKPYVITNNFFSANAISMGLQNEIELIDRDLLKKWIKTHNLTITDIDGKLKDRL